MLTATKTKQQYKLIDGTFTAAEAKTILLNMVSAKIKFHSVEKMSMQERYNHHAEHSKNRLHELKEMMRKLKSDLDEVGHDNMELRITSHIEISFGSQNED